jgi:hypothetical protein
LYQSKGHPAVLYINKMRVAGLFNESIDANLEQLLETGVDEMSYVYLSLHRPLCTSQQHFQTSP